MLSDKLILIDDMVLMGSYEPIRTISSIMSLGIFSHICYRFSKSHLEAGAKSAKRFHFIIYFSSVCAHHIWKTTGCDEWVHVLLQERRQVDRVLAVHAQRGQATLQCALRHHEIEQKGQSWRRTQPCPTGVRDTRWAVDQNLRVKYSGLRSTELLNRRGGNKRYKLFLALCNPYNYSKVDQKI